MVLAKSPHVLLIEVLFGALIFGSTILLHAVTLPVEFDASFRRALPILKVVATSAPRTCRRPVVS